MYEVSANINDVEIVKVPLLPETFQLDVPNILKSFSSETKLLFICCPNNPTGNGVSWKNIQTILENFNGIVVIDEAYINFASYKSLVPELLNYSNLVILQTLSKAWGLAGLRLGMAFASEEIIDLFNKVKPPYNINEATQQNALDAFNNIKVVNNWIVQTVEERKRLVESIKGMSFVITVYPSEANFLLIKVKDANALYGFLLTNGIITRNRSKIELCENCLRITVGTEIQNKELIDVLNNYK
jgi:histidinol-phosphate aminotransferase